MLKNFRNKRKALKYDVFDTEISSSTSSAHKPRQSNICNKKTESKLHKTANNQIEKHRKPLQLISHTTNEHQTLTKIQVVKETQRYLNGMEPKIVNEYFNSKTGNLAKLMSKFQKKLIHFLSKGELMYEIKWYVNSKMDTVTEKTAIKKFPQIIVNYKQTKNEPNKENLKENNADTDRQNFSIKKSVVNSTLKQIESTAKVAELTTKNKIFKEIIDLYDFNGDWKFKVEWTDSKFASEFISAKQLKETHPLDVIKFYEKNIFLVKSQK